MTIMESSDQFLTIWCKTKERYVEMTDQDMNATIFSHLSSVKDLEVSLEMQNNRFEKFREKKIKIFKILSDICDLIELLNNLAAERAALIFSSSSLCFEIIMSLINAARDVSECYDAIITLMITLKARRLSFLHVDVRYLCCEARLQDDERWPSDY